MDTSHFVKWRGLALPSSKCGHICDYVQIQAVCLADPKPTGLGLAKRSYTVGMRGDKPNGKLWHQIHAIQTIEANPAKITVLIGQAVLPDGFAVRPE